MNCAWNELLSVLPHRLRPEVDKLQSDMPQELRLRLGMNVEVILPGRHKTLPHQVTLDELNFVINAASRYSPWAGESAREGFLTAPGGHRIGICGEVVTKGGVLGGFRTVRSLNIRIARDFPGIAKPIADIRGNILLVGPPGSGKTTLLRDLIRLRSDRELIATVDERSELFPLGLGGGQRVDILSGCPKTKGIEMLLRTMGPDTIAVDEITAAEDCEALVQAGWCGVRILATVHGDGQEDLFQRKVYKPIVACGLFETLVILRRDKSFRTERMRV